MHSAVLCVLLGALVQLAALNPACARELAVLVGVAGYEIPAISPLRGPRNDVTIMWRLLRSSGFKDENMVVLADGLPPTGDYPKVHARPTRTAILEALADLAKRAGKDDFVYIHLSSHGSEQPVSREPADSRPTPQPWDRNQVLLAIDVRPSTNQRTIPNGIPDFEFGKALDAVRASAGRVWIVVDMCHAGTATRGELVARYVDPVDLHIKFPSPTVDGNLANATRGDAASIRGQAFLDSTDKVDRAPMVAFFAVDPRELSYEKSFPGYDPPLIGEGERLGVFTYLLHRALRNANATTYRELRNEIVSEIASGAAGAGMPLPMFEGDLDAPIFGVNAIDIRKGWSARYRDGALDISAGAVHGLVPGSLVVIHRGASDKTPEIGQATVEIAQPATSRTKILVAGSIPIPALAENQDIWVTLAKEGVSFVYSISEPPENDRNTEHANVAFAAIAKLKNDKINKGGISADWRYADSEQPDFRLRVQHGSIWITGATGALNTDLNSPFASPSVRISGEQETSDKLFDALWSLARAQNIVRLASNCSPG